MVRAPLLAAVLALGALPALGLDPTRRPSQYVYDNWQIEQGLPQNTVLAVAQTRDGYLWLGTQEGLARFDGTRFVVFDKSNTPALVNHFVTALHEDRDGVLWIGLRGSGVLRYEKGIFSAGPPLSNPRVRAIRQTRDGTVWIATSGGGLNGWRNGHMRVVGMKDGLPSEEVVALHEDRAGNLWVGTFGGGLARYRDGGFQVWRKKDGLPDDQVSSLAEDAQGALWVGTFGGGAARFVDGRFLPLRTADGLLSDQVWTVRPDRDGNVWIGSDGGLNRWRDGQLASFSSEDGLQQPVVVTLLEDGEGSLWLGTYGGLGRLRDGRFVTWGTREGLSNATVLVVLEDRSGTVWIGTDGGGLDRLRDGRITHVSGLSNDHVTALFEDRAGTLWIGTAGGGINLLRDGRVEVLGIAQGLADDVITAILEDRHGTVWIGTDSGGLHRLDAGRVTHLGTKDGFSEARVSALLEDRAGTLWIGTSGDGVIRHREGAFTTLGTEQGLGSNRVASLREDDEGVLWVATSGGGLSRLRDGKLGTVGGLPDDRVFVALEDTSGQVWMSSNRGVSRVAKRDLQAVLDGSARKAVGQSYGAADGMRSAECNGETQPAGWRSRDGRLWFATMGGVAVVDPARQPPPGAAPPVHVEEVVVDGQAHDGRSAVTIAPGSEKVDIRYAAPVFTSPSRARFQVRLEGYDSDWVDAGGERVAHYTRLPPGAFRFQVRAANADGVWNEAGASVVLTQRPFFYQTPWFRAGLAAAAVALAGALHRLRLRTLRRRADELERIVAEQTRDLRAANDDLKQAQEQLARLSEGTPEKVEDVAAWSASMAAEVGRAIRAKRVDVWQLEGDEMMPLVPTTSRPPRLDDVKAARLVEIGSLPGPAIVPVVGLADELRGAVVVHGAPGWGDTERRLVTGLAQHLGSALDVKRLRAQLTASALRQAEVRERMAERGLEALKLCATCWRCYGPEAERCEHDGQALDGSRLLPHVIAGRYRLNRLLGEGGMGSVFAARDEKLGREVAMKVIRADRFQDAGARFRLEREAQALAQVDHASVIELFDTGELEDGSAYLVMELLHGRDLASVLLRYGRGTPAQVAALVRQVGAALGVAHAVGVVHRDVKPANIVIVPDGQATPGHGPAFRAKVLDFGLAKSTRDEMRFTRTGVLVGTPAYMAPEQVEGGTVDARADVYSLGAVVYEALTGRKLVEAQEVGRMFVDVLYAVPAPASQLRPGLSADVDLVLAAALEKQAGARPADVGEWGERLARLLEGLDPEEAGWPIAELAVPRERTAVTLDGFAAHPTTEI